MGLVSLDKNVPEVPLIERETVPLLAKPDDGIGTPKPDELLPLPEPEVLEIPKNTVLAPTPEL